MTNRTNYVILGRKVGMGTGWVGDHDDLCISALEPATGVACPSGDVWFSFMTGQVRVYDDDGNVTWSDDIFVVLQNAERAKP